MIKNAFIRGINSFVYAISINVVLALIITAIINKPNFVPLISDYSARFESKVVAMLLQFFLIGLTSAAFGAGSVILDIKRWSLIKQSIIYFILTAVVWIPVSIFCWRIDKYTTAFVSVICSYTISYIIIWIIQYMSCKKSIAKINQKLNEMNT